jgi:hypothetical protein
VGFTLVQPFQAEHTVGGKSARMKLDLLIRLLWSGWFAVGAALVIVTFVSSWRRGRLRLGQILVSMLLTPIFSVGAVNVWFRPSGPPDLGDGLLVMFVLGAVVTGLAKGLENRRTKT